MYGNQGQLDMYFMMLYGGVAMMAIMSCVYLLLRPVNVIVTNVQSPRELRLWAAAFLATMAGSHVWWILLGQVWLTDDQLVRILILIALDNMTLVPLIMATLLRLLQDRRRPLWLFFASVLPTAVLVIIGVTTRQRVIEWVMQGYVFVVGVIFFVYMVVAVRQYGRWLKDNFADLEHKEVWQSLLAPLCLLPVFYLYVYHGGELYREYLTQFVSIIIIIYIVWRVETLQTLEITDADDKDDRDDGNVVPPTEIVESEVSNIDTSAYQKMDKLLREYCEKKQLYRQHDMTLQQLATAIGTNRTYLGTYFAERGETYNAYINRLRIEHFTQLYRQKFSNGDTATAKELAVESGYHSYSTFGVAFKQYMGMPVTQWIKSINEDNSIDNNESR